MEGEVADAVRQAEADRNVRAIVLTGAGRGFCAGADLSGSNRPPGAPAPLRPGADRFHFMWECAKPLIAAINGPAMGVGLSVALHCDLRFIAETASIATSYARRGLIAEHGSAWLLPRIVGMHAAADLLLSGRKIEADEAVRMGLAEPLPAEGFLQEVQARAAALVAESSPRSMRVIRRQIQAGFSQDYAAAQVLALEEQLESFKSEDFKEGVAAFREKRTANFTGD